MPEIGTQTEESNFNLKSNEKNKLKDINTLILSGGFLSGYFYLGFSKYIHENNINKQITTYIASSIGCILTLYLILDYTQTEIEEIITENTMDYYENFNYLNIVNFNDNFGIDNGEILNSLLKNIIGNKTGNPYISFKDLYELTNKNIVFTGTNISSNKITDYFSHLTTPDMSVWLAIRISCSFPIFYTTVKYNNNVYIDGGVSSSCPIEGYNEIFNESFEVNKKHILILLLQKIDKSESNIDINIMSVKNKLSIIVYIKNLISSLRFQDKNRIKQYKNNIIEFYFQDKKKSKDKVSLMPYKENIDKEDIFKYINRGYELTKKYFE